MELLETKYEYSKCVNNIDSLGECGSINTTERILRDDNIRRHGLEEVKGLIKKLRIARSKCYFKNEDFDTEFDFTVFEWDQNSQIKFEDMDMNSKIEGFITYAKSYNQFYKAYIFEDFDKFKIWLLLEDSTCEESDYIFSKFLDEFDQEQYELMMFDKDVEESVKHQLESLNTEYKVFDIDGF